MGTFPEALNELLEAQKLYEDAKAKTAHAMNRETTELNRLNAAQKKIDGLLADLCKGSPHGSDWGRKHGR